MKSPHNLKIFSQENLQILLRYQKEISNNSQLRVSGESHLFTYALRSSR